jgi:hypothetical protein
MPAIKQNPLPALFDRRFYGCSAIAVAAIALLGFSRTYYLKAFFATHALTPFMHFHGMVMSAWIAVNFTARRLA